MSNWYIKDRLHIELEPERPQPTLAADLELLFQAATRDPYAGDMAVLVESRDRLRKALEGRE